ncbi:porin OmpA [Aeromonas schubertii]|uniref:Outer membrane protein A n=1 Tax=Aeromonas schubertii TaxID=652 RepID=A0A0S2SL69_9GAMM|nr:porin OmpA [Aeromonas schubertii]ALP42479.1 outer membrane protein A [Aeromonas schubertii]
MNRYHLSLLPSLLLAGGTHAAPDDQSWYIGAKVGWSNYFDADTQRLVEEINGRLQSRQESGDGLGAGLFAGYQLNRNVGFELGYDWLGRYKTEGALDGLLLSGEVKGQMLQGTVKIGGAFNERLDLYTRMGGAYAWADATATAHYGGRSVSETGKEHSAAFVAALGAEYALNPSWALRLEYQYTTPIGDASWDRTAIELDNGLLALGLVYRLGQWQSTIPATSPPAEIPPARVIINQRFSLNSDVLFEFNQSGLKSEAHQALDRLFAQIEANRPRDGMVTVTGHTDRLGRDDYNLGLSQRRAQSVANYLIGKGIPANKIYTEGRGQHESVTGAQCHGHERRRLISCLAPDRRVEILVEGVRPAL